MGKMLLQKILITALCLCGFNIGVAQQQYFVKVNDSKILRYNGSRQVSQGRMNASVMDSVCSFTWSAQYGQTVPNTGGGTLSPAAFMNSTTINSSGRVAFFSNVDGSSRNQGIFVADTGGTVYSIAIGSGGVGGSGDTTSMDGDPSPIGGKFGGFFSGTMFTPDINNAGDVLFMADVNGGDARRGLFLYKAAAQQIVKVAAVDDPSPLGGRFTAIGPGSMNNNGKVVFLACLGTDVYGDIFMWDNGTITKVASVGDAAPGGGTYSHLGTESYGFQDGTSIPGGPLPGINDLDQIAFRAIVSGGIAERGIIVRTNGTDSWYIKAADTTPAGGTYLDMQAPSINNSGEIAFFSDYRPTPTTANTAWFAGKPGSWRKVIASLDSLDGGQALWMAYSRNPMKSIDEQGNVLFWTDIDPNGGTDRMVLGKKDGSFLIVARRQQPSPNGGIIASMNAWPSLNGYWGTVSSATPGGTGMNAHMVFARCPETPVELTSFTAALNGTNVSLNWSTATETNNRGFEVQRNQGNGFVTIGFVKGNGTTTESRTYLFTDNNIAAGKYSYRLKQIDFNGASEFSPEVEVNFSTPAKFALEQNYPNPFNPSTNIKYTLAQKQFVTLKVYDVLGNEIAALVNEEKPAGSYTVEFNANNLSAGVYFYKIEAAGADGNNFTSVKKMMFIK